MPGDRGAVIAACHQCYRRPEGNHRFEMRIPIVDTVGKDWAEQRIATHPVIEAMHEALEHLVIETRARHQIKRNFRADTDYVGSIDGCHEREFLKRGLAG